MVGMIRKFYVSVRNKRKVFVIGMNKTGTTSIKDVLSNAGYLLGDQRIAERMIHDIKNKDFRPLIRYCHSAEAFQDIPFSIPGVYKELHKAFPDSKFILSKRSNADEWYNSLLRFHTKRFGKRGLIPTVQDLKEANYVWKGWMYEVDRLIFGDHDLYDRAHYKKVYCDHINEVRAYFKKTESLIEVDVKEAEDFKKLSKFLNFNTKTQTFPHLNKT